MLKEEIEQLKGMLFKFQAGKPINFSEFGVENMKELVEEFEENTKAMEEM